MAKNSGGGGRRGGGSGVLVMSRDEYAATVGAGRFVVSDDLLRFPHGVTNASRRATIRAMERDMARASESRAAAFAQYDTLLAAGRVRAPSRVESLIRAAHGHEDNQTVQAARRVLQRMGVTW